MKYLDIEGIILMNNVQLLAGWDAFGQGLTSFFKDGLGGPGSQGIAIAIMVVGIIGAVIAFALHKFNPQTRWPGPIVCIMVGICGALIYGGVDKPIAWFKSAADWIFSVLGV